MPTPQSSPHKRAILAFDPFDESSRSHHAIFNVLGHLSRNRHLEVEPAYVLNPGTFNLRLKGDLESKARQSTEMRMRAKLQGFGMPGLCKPRVLIQREGSIQSSVRKLLAHAQRTGATLIATETHARKGLARLFMGSFAETLILESKIPILIVNPASRPRPLRRLLFPSDLSPEGKKAFLQLIALAKELSAQVDLLHVTPRPVEPLLQSGALLLAGAFIPPLDPLRDEQDQARQIADEWIAEAAKRGVPVKAFYDSGYNGIRTAILTHATHRKSDLIAMAAQSGKMEATLIGSITRQVIREAACPVWVVRSGP